MMTLGNIHNTYIRRLALILIVPPLWLVWIVVVVAHAAVIHWRNVRDVGFAIRVQFAFLSGLIGDCWSKREA